MHRRPNRARPAGFAALIALVLAPAVGSQDAGLEPRETTAPARLEVTVLDDAGEPVEGALITALPSTGGYRGFGIDPEKLRATVTGAGGRTTLESLPPGPWTVGVQARGFAPHTDRRVAAGPLEVRLEKGGAITGVVADAEGVPLADARVSLDPGFPLPSAWVAEASRVETTTDAEGRFRLEGIGPDR